jgi:hypothetical protein
MSHAVDTVLNDLQKVIYLSVITDLMYKSSVIMLLIAVV